MQPLARVAAAALSGRRTRSGARAAVHTFRPEAVTYVSATDDVTLVRVSGSWRRGHVPAEVRLSVELARAREVFEPLPAAGSAGDELWRIAFAVPTELLGERPISLTLIADGVSAATMTVPPAGVAPERTPDPAPAKAAVAPERTPDPAPAKAAAAPAQPAHDAGASTPAPAFESEGVRPQAPGVEAWPVTPAPPRPATPPQVAAEAGAEGADPETLMAELADARVLVEQLERRCDLAERGVSEFRQKLVHAWGEANELRQLLEDREQAYAEAKERARKWTAAEDDLRAEFEGARADVVRERDDLAAELEQARAALAETRQRADSAAADAEAARAALGDAETRLAAANDDLAEQADARHADAVAQLAEARSEVDAATAEVARLRGALAEVEARSEAAAASVTDATALERDLTEAQRSLAELREAAERDRTKAELALAEVREGAERDRGQAELALAALREAAERDRADAERALLELREAAERERNELEQRTAAAASAEQKLRDELRKARDHADGAESRKGRLGGWRRRSSVEQPEDSSPPAEELELKVTSLLDRIAQLEHELETANRAGAAIESEEERTQQLEALRQALTNRQRIEDDLRAALAGEKKALAQARSEVQAMRNRLTDTPGALPVEPEKIAAEPGGWSALDEDLLGRLSKAKALAGSDD